MPLARWLQPRTEPVVLPSCRSRAGDELLGFSLAGSHRVSLERGHNNTLPKGAQEKWTWIPYDWESCRGERGNKQSLVQVTGIPKKKKDGHRKKNDSPILTWVHLPVKK